MSKKPQFILYRTAAIEGYEEVWLHLRKFPDDIFHIRYPTIAMVIFSYLNARDKNIKQEIKDHRLFSGVEKFFKKNPHIGLANEIGFFDE